MNKLIKTFMLVALAAGFCACSDDEPAPAQAAQTPAPEASQITENSFSVSWAPVDGIESYAYVLQHKGANGSIVPIVAETETEELSVVFNDLKPSTEYTFRVKAIGDGTKWLDSEWAKLTVTTASAAYLAKPWVEVGDITYQKHNYMSTYCYINVAFTPNDKTASYYATVMNGNYFDDDPDTPGFEPNTEEDLKSYLLAQSPVSNNKIREQNYWGREVIVAVIGVDAAGEPGELNWTRIKIPTKSEFEGGGGDDTPSAASLRIQHVVINSGELEGAPADCFATVYRFEMTNGAKSFRYEDGFYPGDFAKKEVGEWRDYFTSITNAYGEKYDGFYSGWKSSMELESSDGLYYYDVTFWDASAMAGQSFEVLYLSFDADAKAGTPGCYTVTLPEKLPEITDPTDPAQAREYRAAAEVARQFALKRGITVKGR